MFKIKNHNIKLSSTKYVSVGEITNRYELIVVMGEKMYPKMHYKHQLRNVQINETPSKFKAQELQVIG